MRITYRNKPPGRGLGSLLLGSLVLVLGLMWLGLVISMINLWVHRDEYIEAELEVVRYHYHEPSSRSRSSKSPNVIEGIIHPGGEEVTTNDRNISVSIFESKSSAVGRQPTVSEVEGKRYKVIHWPHHQREWHHPATTMTTTIPRMDEVVLHALIVFCLVGGGGLLIRRGRRVSREQNTAPAGPGAWPHWTGGAVMLTLVLWFFFWLICTVVLPGQKLNSAGTELLSRTTKEWIIGGGFLTLMGGLSLAMTWMCGKAVKQRLSRRT